MTVTSGRHAQKDKERQQRIESDIRWGLKDPDQLKRPRCDTNGGSERGEGREREGWVLLKIPRGDRDWVGEVK